MGEQKKPDDTLIGYLQTLGVAERLALNDAAIRATVELRKAFAPMQTAPKKRIECH